MGQQQLLLLVLAVIIVGIAIVVGISMFNAQAASANLDAVTNDLMNLGSRAQQYYIRPESMAGGGGDFDGMTILDLTTDDNNENGIYTLMSGSGQTAVIRGDGRQDGDDDGTNCRAEVTVWANDSMQVNVLNR
jgi:hypothetical protein